MMRTLTTCAAALCLPVLLAAQSGDAKQSPAQVAAEKLTAELNKQNRAYRAASAALRETEAYKKALEERDREAMTSLRSSLKRPDTAALGQKAIDLSAKFEGDERVRLLGWAAIHSRDKDIIRKVVADLSESHLKSPALVDLMEQARAISRPLGAKASAAFLTRVIEESPHAQVRAWAMYWAAVSMQRGGGSEEGMAKAAAMLDQAEKLADGTALADKIRGPKFKKERLQIGMVAPNIVGNDMDGVEFALEDYRGKVVVLDFWGFW